MQYVGGFKGLNPKILPLIVKKAHQAGLRVSTHINTAFDFGVAVRAGVDEINHLPGRFSSGEKDFEQYVIKEEDAKLAGEKGIYMVPTYSLLSGNKNIDKTYMEKAQDVQRKNLKLLNKYDVKIAFGPDSYNVTSQTEAFYIKDLGVFSNLELLKIWSENTPQTVFPNRKIAHLKDGFEASFVAMPNDPLKNFEAVKNINYRFKQGVPIDVEKEESRKQN
jgi:imidazolonepropionase-like amidohydrolase